MKNGNLKSLLTRCKPASLIHARQINIFFTKCQDQFNPRPSSLISTSPLYHVYINPSGALHFPSKNLKFPQKINLVDEYIFKFKA